MNNNLLNVAVACRETCQYVAAHSGEISGHIDSDTLGGMCAIASEFLFIKLRQAKIYVHFINSTMVNVMSHCYNYYDGHIIDITATQFNKSFSPLYIQKAKDIKHLPWETYALAWSTKLQKQVVCDTRLKIRNSLAEWSPDEKLTEKTYNILNKTYMKITA
jgi:hypothetical protein